MTADAVMLKLEGLRKSFGGVAATRDVSLAFHVACSAPGVLPLRGGPAELFAVHVACRLADWSAAAFDLDAAAASNAALESCESLPARS